VKTEQSENKDEFNDVTDEDDVDYDSYLSEDDGPNFILYQWRWVNLAFYFMGLITSGFNMVCFSSVGPQVGRAYGFMKPQPPGPPPPNADPDPHGHLTADSTYIDSIPIIYLVIYVPFNFVVIKSLEKKGLRFTVSSFLTLDANGRYLHYNRKLGPNWRLGRQSNGSYSCKISSFYSFSS